MKKLLSMVLVICMMFSFTAGAFAESTTVADGSELSEASDPAAASEAAETAEETEEVTEEDFFDGYDELTVEETVTNEAALASTGSTGGTLDTSTFYTMVLIDCGRGFYSVSQIETIIDKMSACGYQYLMLGFGNDGLRFVLDDMSVTVNGTTYASDTVKNAVISANDALQSNSGNGQWTESEMDGIISYAAAKGIGIVPMIDVPGHSYSICKAMEACGLGGVNSAYYQYSSNGTVNQRNLSANLSDSTVEAFMETLVGKYIDYFAGKGCTFFNLGCDEIVTISASQAASFITDLCAMMPDTMVPLTFCDVLGGTSGYPDNLVGIDWQGGYLSGHYNLNANDNWYYVLGNSEYYDGWSTYYRSLNYTKSTPVTTTLGSETAYGSVLAIWNDNYYAAASYIDNIENLIESQSSSNPGYFDVVTSKDISVNVGATVTETVDDGSTITAAPDSSIATAALGQKEVTSTGLSAVTSITSGSRYVISLNRTGSNESNTVLTSTASGTKLVLSGTASESSETWTFTSTGTSGSYYVTNSAGKYLTISSGGAAVTSTQTALTLTYVSSVSSWQLANGSYYLNQYGGSGCAVAGGYTSGASSDVGSRWTLYGTGDTTTTATVVTFTGVSAGTTSATVGNVIYNITVNAGSPAVDPSDLTGETASTVSVSGSLRAFHLDCGRKYFSASQIEAIIDTMAADGYNTLELAIGNDGLRFVLDDMTVTVNGTTYSSATVKSAIQTGNVAYSDQGASNELSQSEMNEIISYAAAKGIMIIPLINTPGHMDTLLDVAETLSGTTCAYNGSARTIDVTSSTAVAFTKAILQRYIDYFAACGCTYFNMGADEYANDVYGSGSMGFGNLISAGKYSYYVTYVNAIASMIESSGMTPIAFNDGIYFNSTTSGGTFDTNIVIAYWSSGWSGYNVATASYLVNKGFKILNTNGSWYYVLGSGAISTTVSNLKSISSTTVTGSTVAESDQIGCMICFWCDTPSCSYDSTEAANLTTQLDTFAEVNGFTPTELPEQAITVEVGKTATVTFDGTQSISEAGDESIATAVITTEQTGTGSVSYSASASASSTAYSTTSVSYPTSYLIDGNTSTYYWSSTAQSSGMYARVDLGAEVRFDAVQVTSTSHASDYCTNANVQVSSDGSTWTTIGTFSGKASSAVTSTYEVPESVESFRYIQVVLTSSSTYWWQLAEIAWGSYSNGTFTRAAASGTISGASAVSTLTFTGVKAGTTSYVVNGTRYVVTVEAPSHTHSYTSTVTTEATCTTAGVRTYTCTCGDTYTESIPATGHNYETTTVPATCTEAGATVTTCTKCGESTSVAIPALGHDYQETSTTAATCAAEGKIVYTCSRCGASYTETIAKTNDHHYVSAVTTEPTCTAEGVMTYTCSVCGTSYTEAIAKVAHNYVTTTTEPTCTEAGATVTTCTMCGESSSTPIAALGHDYQVTSTKAATCAAEGEITYTCTRCGDTYTEKTEKTTDHQYVGAVTTEPTCAKEGVMTYTCSVCGTSYTEAIAKIAHNYVTSVVDPTCTTEGATVYTCSVCGDSYSEPIAKVAHNYVTTTTEPTCTEAGATVTTCTMCGESSSTPIAALGHDYQVTSTKAATCAAEGEITYTCTRCGDTYTVKTEKTNDHQYVSAVTTEPTCTAEGVMTYTCSVCGTSYTEAIAKIAHNYVTSVVDPTCTTEGATVYTCSVCGDSYSEPIAKIAHNYVTTTTEPTCTEAGATVTTCTMCGESSSTPIAALGHDYQVTSTKAATCAAEGEITYTCTRCGDTYTEKTEKTTDHQYVGAVTTAPTCTAEGVRTYTCSVCGTSYTEAIAKIAHNYVTTTTDPTCTEAGATVTTCTMCGASTSVAIPALGHDYTSEEKDGQIVYTCTRCGDTYTEEITIPTVNVGLEIGETYTVTAEGTIETAPDSSIATASVETLSGGYNAVTELTAGKYLIVNGTRMLTTTASTYYSSWDGAGTVNGLTLTTFSASADNDASLFTITPVSGGYTVQCADGRYLNIAQTSISGSVTLSTTAQTLTINDLGSTFAIMNGSNYLDMFSTSFAGSYPGSCNSNETWTLYKAESAGTQLTITGVANGTTAVVFGGTRYLVTVHTHSYTSAVTTEPTCTTAGTRTYTCTCGDSYTESIAATGHSYSSAVTTEPTCTAAGVRTYTCANCGESYTESIAALGHSYTSETVGDTIVYTCSRCGDSYSEAVPSTTYDKVSSISSGNQYLITVVSGSTYYALTHDGTTLGVTEVTVSDGQVTSEVTDNMLWDYNGKFGFTDGSTTYYLYKSSSSSSSGWGMSRSYTLKISTSGTSATYSSTSSRLSFSSYYLRYSSGSLSLSRSSYSTCYMFQVND